MVKVDFDLKGVKIPKQVGGVKVPKKLRKKGKKLVTKAASPEGRKVIAAGLAIAGSVIAAKAQVKATRAAERAGERAAEHAAEAARAANGDTGSARVFRHPRAPGQPGIDPAHDPAADLGDAIAAGIDAFQKFMGTMKR